MAESKKTFFTKSTKLFWTTVKKNSISSNSFEDIVAYTRFQFQNSPKLILRSSSSSSKLLKFSSSSSSKLLKFLPRNRKKKASHNRQLSKMKSLSLKRLRQSLSLQRLQKFLIRNPKKKFLLKNSKRKFLSRNQKQKNFHKKFPLRNLKILNLRIYQSLQKKKFNIQ